MTKIYQVSGAEMGAVEKGFTFLGYPLEDLTSGQMDLLSARNLMAQKRDIVARRKGIGSLRAQKFQNTMDVMDDGLYGIETFDSLSDQLHWMGLIEEAILAGEYANEHMVHGIGSLEEIGALRKKATAGRRGRLHKRMKDTRVAGIAGDYIGKSKTKTGGFLKKAAQKTTKAVKSVANKTQTAAKKAGGAVKTAAKKTGGAVKTAAKKTGTAVKKAAQKVATVAKKVVTAPVRALIEVTLPQSGPFFLYLFIQDQAIIDKLPAKVKRKRDKAIKIRRFVVNNLGISEAHFMSLCRSGIMKKLGASPETLLSGMIRSISGIGDEGGAAPGGDGMDVAKTAATVAAAASSTNIVIDLINKIVALFKKNKEEGVEPSADDAPSADDWEGTKASQATVLSAEIKKQNDAPEPNEERPTPMLPTSNSGPENNYSPSGGGGSSSSSSSSGGGSSSENSSSSSSSSSSGGSGGGGGGGSTSSSESEEDNTAPANTDANGEIKNEPFSSGGRKGWISA